MFKTPLAFVVAGLMGLSTYAAAASKASAASAASSASAVEPIDDGWPELDSDSPSPVHKAITVGHNVTPSTETLKAGVWTVGNYALAVGLSDHFFIATSPWIWVSYNTANVHLKIIKDLGRFKFGAFSSYFHSFNSTPLFSEATGSASICTTCRTIPQPVGGGPPHLAKGDVSTFANTPNVTFQGLNRYQWENITLHGLASYDFESGIKLYGNVMYSYFWNDDLPYSIRMDPGTDSIRGQVDLTTLTQYPVAKNFFVNFEYGVLGANYIYPYMQTGLSFEYLDAHWLLQLGASATNQWREAFQKSAWVPGRYDERLHISKSEGDNYYYRYLQTALHPEVQIQYFF